MQKVFNLMALTSFLISASLAAGAFMAYKNKDAVIEGAREKIVKEI